MRPFVDREIEQNQPKRDVNITKNLTMTKSVLSNCYALVRVAAAPEEGEQPTPISFNERKNGDGETRTNETLRRLCLETSVLSSSKPGSSLVELGHTKIICNVLLCVDGNHAQVDTGVLLVRVSQAANFGMPPPSAVSTLDKGVNTRSNTKAAQSQSVDMEARLHAALLPALNMQSDDTNWENLAVLSGEVMHEDAYFQQVHNAKHLPHRSIGLLVKENST